MEEIGKTEQAPNSSNTNFKSCFTLDFIFEQRQYLEFDVEDVDVLKANGLIGYMRFS